METLGIVYPQVAWPQIAQLAGRNGLGLYSNWDLVPKHS